MPLPPQKRSAASPKKPPKVALVLGSGGAKGIAHIGTLKVLHQAGIPIDLIVGCSIGALIGSFYADGHDPDHIFQRALELIPRKPDYKRFGLPSLSQGFSGNGFFSTQHMQNILMEELGARTFEELKIPFKVIATDIRKGTLTTFSKGPLMKPICASAAIPAFFKPVTIDERQYVDGGIITELPIDVARKSGAQLIIASNVKGWLTIQKRDEVENLGVRSYYIMRHHFDQEQEAQADVIIRPNLSGVMNLLFSNPVVMEEVYKRGKRSAKKQLPYIEEMIKKLKIG